MDEVDTSGHLNVGNEQKKGNIFLNAQLFSTLTAIIGSKLWKQN